MAFQEKSAWVMTVALLLGAVVYFGMVVIASSSTGALATPALPMIALYTVALIVIAIAGHVVAAAQSPKEADAPLDERERRIAEAAGHRSSYVLGVGVILSLGVYLLSGSGNLLFYVVFGSLMLAQIVEYAVRIFLYRTGV